MLAAILGLDASAVMQRGRGTDGTHAWGPNATAVDNAYGLLEFLANDVVRLGA